MRKNPFLHRVFLASAVICAALSSCKKDKPADSTSIIGRWKMTGYIHNGADVFGTAVGPCVTDDVITFSNPDILSVDEGPTKCDDSDPQGGTGKFSLNSAATLLTLTYNGSTDTDTVVVLNATTLQLKQTNNDLITHTRLP